MQKSREVIRSKSMYWFNLTSNKRKRDTLVGYLFIFPTMIGFLVFSLIPTVSIFILSLFKWDLLSKPVFIGFRNFTKLFNDPTFIHVILVSFKYVVLNLLPQWIIGMILALCLFKIKRGIKFYRTIFLIPWITTPIAMSIVWKWILNPSIGMLNYYLEYFGIGRIDWFSTSNALYTISMVNIWQFVGFTTLLFLVGLQSIPTSYFEAASIDGSNSFNTFWNITIPLLKPTLAYVFITGFINSFQVFDSVYGMTQGGPGDATRVYYFAVYEEAFKFLNMGYASAMCVILFLILMCVTIFQVRIFRDNPEY